MPLFRTLFVFALLALATPVSAQSVDDLEHLPPALPETPRALTSDERLCDAIDGYIAAHPGAQVAIRLPERTETLDVHNPIHLQVLRYHAAATYLASVRASGRTILATQARAWATASRSTMLMDQLRRAYRLSSTEPLNIEWTLSYPGTVWCRAVRAGREPNPRQAQPGSLVSRICEYDPLGVGRRSLPLCREPAPFGFGDGHRSPIVYDMRTGAVLPLPTPGTTVFGALRPSAGRRGDTPYGSVFEVLQGLPGLGIGYDDAERVNRTSNPAVDPAMLIRGRPLTDSRPSRHP